MQIRSHNGKKIVIFVVVCHFFYAFTLQNGNICFAKAGQGRARPTQECRGGRVPNRGFYAGEAMAPTAMI